jgi:hypothetical protein
MWSKSSLLPTFVLTLVLGTMLFSGQLSLSMEQPKHTSASKVKAEIVGVKSDANAGTQQVTIKLIIDKGYHIYANPVENEEFRGTETTVTVTSAHKPLEVKTTYPPGKVLALARTRLKIYQGQITLTTVVRRAPGDTTPLQITISVQATNEEFGLPPAQIKLTAPSN